jgi:hypothetical protein
VNEAQAFPSLFRYFMWASLMREYFDRALPSSGATSDAKDGFLFFSTQPGIFMTYWYGGLYVVIEGWRELGLHEPAIDELLESPNVELLRRFRNGAFHFQNAWLDDRLVAFCGAARSVGWVRTLTQKLHDYLTNEMHRRYGSHRAL